MYPVIHIGFLSFYTFGLVVGAAACLLGRTYTLYFRLHRVPVDHFSFLLTTVASALLGAILDSSAVSLFHHHQLDAGLTYLGAVIAGVLAQVVYARIFHIPLLQLFDSLFCIAPAYALGRVGCFMSGDGDYGIPTTLPWGVSFPHGIVPTTARVHPTMLYLAAWELAVFAILWRLSKSRRQTPLRPGTLLGCYLIATGTTRFLVEFLSLNTVLAFGLKEAQLVSLVMMASGALILGHVFLVVKTETPSVCGGTHLGPTARHIPA